MLTWKLTALFLMFPLYNHLASSCNAPLYEYLKLNLMWPATYIKKMRGNVSELHGHISLHDYRFTIHGLWVEPAQGQDRKDVINCHSDEDLQREEYMRPIWQMMVDRSDGSTLFKDWPSFEDSRSFLFWKHEWVKHGSCVVELTRDVQRLISNSKRYFEHSLNLAAFIDRRFSTSNSLTGTGHNVNICFFEKYGGKVAHLSVLEADLFSLFGIRVTIKCYNFFDNNYKIRRSLIDSIEFCYDPRHVNWPFPMNCSIPAPSKKDCELEDKVELPVFDYLFPVLKYGDLHPPTTRRLLSEDAREMMSRDRIGNKLSRLLNS